MRFNSPFLVKLAGRTCGLGFRMLFSTLQKELHLAPGATPYNNPGPQRFLFAAWHDSAVIAAFGGKHSKTVALTSRHRDGAFVEGVVGAKGVKSVRGSSGKSGSRAARELMETAKQHDIVITPDGPRGPRRVLSRGIVYLASRTGNAVVPTAYACENAWEIPGSWTTQIIPKPFSRVVLMAGEPIFVPPDVPRDEIETHRAGIQAAIDKLQTLADRLMNREPSDVAEPAAEVDAAQKYRKAS